MSNQLCDSCGKMTNIGMACKCGSVMRTAAEKMDQMVVFASIDQDTWFPIKGYNVPPEIKGSADAMGYLVAGEILELETVFYAARKLHS